MVHIEAQKKKIVCTVLGCTTLVFIISNPFFEHFKLITPLFLRSPIIASIIVEIRSCGETLSQDDLNDR